MATFTDPVDGAPAPLRRGRGIRVAFLAAVVATVTLIPFGTASMASPEGASPAASAPVLPGEPNPPWEDGAVPAE